MVLGHKTVDCCAIARVGHRHSKMPGEGRNGQALKETHGGEE